jgi:hypothetical protein
MTVQEIDHARISQVTLNDPQHLIANRQIRGVYAFDGNALLRIFSTGTSLEGSPCGPCARKENSRCGPWFSSP